MVKMANGRCWAVMPCLHFRLTNLLRTQMTGLLLCTLLLTQTLASPVWMPQFLSGGTGRNIRHLPCVSRRTGEQGTCMFAYTCMKANGTHLGTCIDRFYFGSCCKLSGHGDPLLENDLQYPLVNNNKVTDMELPSVSTIVDAVKLGTGVSNTHIPTTITTTDKVYVPISTSETKPNKTEDFIFGETMKKPVSTTVRTSTVSPSTTTQQYKLSTFQVVHDNSPVTTPTTPVSTTTTTTRPQTTAKLTTTTKASTTTKRTTTTTKKPTKPTKATTRKPPTKKPTSKPSTAKPIKATSAKPLAATTTTKKPLTSTTNYKPVSTITNKPTTKPTKKPITTKPVTTTTTTTLKPAFDVLSTTSEVVFTKPGSNISSGLTTFRPDLSQTTRPSLITGPGLTTFTYISEKVTPSPTHSTATNVFTTERATEKPSSSENQSNLIFQQAGTVATTQSTTVNFFPGSTVSVSKPWIEISTSKPGTTEKNSTETSTPKGTTNQQQEGTTTDAPTTVVNADFGDLNISDYTQVCGRRLYPDARVVGGEKATFGKWPWQISLRQWRTSTYLHKCGAALLNENWAITAAHCVENVPPSDLLLRLGEHDLSREDEPYGYQERRVQIVASHPQFDPRTFEYDLALLRFYEPVKFQPNIIPICVPQDSLNFVGQTAHVTGWGRLYEDGPLPSVLQEVSVPVINNTICENMYRSAGYIEHIPDIFICAGWKKGGFDSCEGDSGGPMVIQRSDKRWLLAGVISWGIGCAEPNQPGVYTRISEFRDWINQILQF